MEGNKMCEFETLIEQIREKYNLTEAQSVTQFVDNLAAEVDFYKRHEHSFEKVVNDLRAILKLERGESIIEAVKELKREPSTRYEERILDPVRMMDWLVGHGWAVDRFGGWYGKSDGKVSYFSAEMWQYCGGKSRNLYEWHPEWIEKVEIKWKR
jgi:hypothetical protein